MKNVKKKCVFLFWSQSLPCDPAATSDCAKTLIVGGSRARGPNVWPSQNGGAAVSLPCAPGDGSGVATGASSGVHCNRRGAAPRASLAKKIRALDAPKNCAHFAARLARMSDTRAWRPRIARPWRCARGGWRAKFLKIHRQGSLLLKVTVL